MAKALNLLGFAQKKQTNKRQKTMRQKKNSQLSSWQEQETFWALLKQKKRLMPQTSYETKSKLQQNTKGEPKNPRVKN